MYKASQYNYFLEKEDRIIYFNGITGVMFSLSKEEHHNISNLFKDLISFKIQYNSIFDRFIDWGFIVKEDIDEIDFLRFRNRMETFSNKNYRVTINPTEDCVFNCWYCNQHTQSSGRLSDENIEKVKKHLEYMVKEEKITSLYIDWFGGEPLIYFDKVMYPIAKRGIELVDEYELPLSHHITTNAYLIDKAMVEKMKEIRIKSFQITLDGDEKPHNSIRNAMGKPSFERIMNNINLILEEMPYAWITLRLNYDDSTLEVGDIPAVFDKIPSQYRNRVGPNLQRVWQTIKLGKMGSKPKVLDLNSTLIKMGYCYTETNAFLKSTQSIKCYADRFYYSVIDYDGKVYKCTANKNKEAGLLLDDGVIMWENEVLTKLYANTSFENEKCLKCKCLPICLGTCTQHATPNMIPDRCALEYAEISPENHIIAMYEHQVMNNTLKTSI